MVLFLGGRVDGINGAMCQNKPAQALDPTFQLYFASKKFSAMDHFQSNLIDFQFGRVLGWGFHTDLARTSFYQWVGPSPYHLSQSEMHELHVNDLLIGVVTPMGRHFL